MPARVSTPPQWLRLGFREDDRILVTGATGWFGRTMLDLLQGHPNVLACASTEGPGVHTWSDRSVRDFAPTVVANFAFLTRDRLSALDQAEFVKTNEMLTQRFIFAIDQPTVRLGMTVSSGAALDPQDIYGRLKAQEESAALARIGPERTVVVARAYSVSGPHVRRPEAYALSDLVAQALDGALHIKADRPVFRRYASVSDVLKVSFLVAGQGWSGVLESGGDLVEMQDLAEVVRDVVNPDVMITRDPQVSSSPQVYASDNSSWLAACARARLECEDLVAQVRAVRDFLVGR